MTPPDWSDIARYLAAEDSAEERARLEAWMAAGPANRAHVADLQRVWTAAGAPRDAGLPTADEAAADRARLFREIAPPTRQAAPDREPQRRARRAGPVWARSLAVLAVVAVAAVAVPRLLHDRPPADAPRADVAFREIATQAGQNARVRLGDGTEVVLGAASRLRLPETFAGAATRDVHLEGEAYFQVAHDPAHPFLVHSGEALVRVTGTAFGVRAYAGASGVEVAVREGSVVVRPEAGGAAVALRPGQLGTLAAGARQATVRAVDVDHYLGWMHGRLFFDDAPLADVVTRLEERFSAHGTVEGAHLRSLRVSATLEARSLPDVLDALTQTLGVGYEMPTDSTFVLTSR